MSRRVVGRLGLALLVVLAGVAGPMSGSAAAEVVVSKDCDIEDLAFGGVYTVVNPEDSCGLYNDRSELSEIDAYASGLAMSDSRDAYLTTRNNLNQDVRGLMWMKGKAAAVEALNNNATEAEAKAAFSEAVNNYTSRLIKNDIRRHEAAMVQTAYLSNQTGGTATTVGTNVEAYSSLAQVVYRLPDGENITVDTTVTSTSGDKVLPFTYYGRFDIIDHFQTGWSSGELQLQTSSWAHGTADYNAKDQIYVGHPDISCGGDGVATYGDETKDGCRLTKAVDFNATAYQISEYLNAGDQVRANGDQYISDFYANYSAGEISSADLWDPITLAQEASTDYNSTGYYSFANAEVSALGLAGDTNISHTVETQLKTGELAEATNTTNATYKTTTHDATIEGTLFLAGSSSISLQTGTQYDPANLSGTPYMTVANATNTTTGEPIEGAGRIVELRQPFTIVEATDTQTGNTVSTTSAESKDYETTNATRLQDVIDELTQLREYYENQQTTTAGAPEPDIDTNSGLLSELSDFLGLTSGITAALLLGGAVLILRGRS